MIRTLRGRITEVMPDGVVVDVGGVGYLVAIPARSVPRPGSDVSFYIYTHVREDELSLYGFTSAEDLAMFRALLTVPSIGPKLALGILGAATPTEIRAAVVGDNLGFFASIPGVGKKSAAKIIVELKGKLVAGTEIGIPTGGSDLAEALARLGYSPAEVQPLFSRLPADLANPEAQLSWALKELAR